MWSILTTKYAFSYCELHFAWQPAAKPLALALTVADISRGVPTTDSHGLMAQKYHSTSEFVYADSANNHKRKGAVTHGETPSRSATE
jgi:hypothetical protein